MPHILGQQIAGRARRVARRVGKMATPIIGGHGRKTAGRAAGGLAPTPVLGKFKTRSSTPRRINAAAQKAMFGSRYSR
jgi:hypothetical protein